MKKFFHAALVLPLVLFAVSCSESNDDGGNGGNEGGGNTPTNIELTGGTSAQQQVYADETETPAPIKFTAKAAWTATVAKVQTKAEGGSEVDWLKLDAYSGGAGDVSLTMTLLPNYTRTDRKAEIRIECAGTTLTITVEQKGTKQDGTMPEPTPTGYALVESVEARFWVGCEENGDYSSSFHYVFRYDDQNRIAEYELTDRDYNGTGSELDYKYTTRFDYSKPGEILLTETTTYDANNTQDQPRTETYRIQLDNQGRATQIKADKSSFNDSPITYRYSYNDEGRLSRISWYDYNESQTEIYEAMTYQNGVLSKVNYHYYADDKKEIVFPADAFSDVPNDRLNIDPNWLVFTDPTEPQELLPMLRLTGKCCDRLTLWLPIDYEEDNIPPSEELPLGYPNPGEKKHETIVYYEHHKTEPLKYTFNDDGTIASIVQPVVHIKMQYDCDIVVGNELFDPERPDMGYKYTIPNETTRKLQENTDTHEWTFTYRK